MIFFGAWPNAVSRFHTYIYLSVCKFARCHSRDPVSSPQSERAAPLISICLGRCAGFVRSAIICGWLPFEYCPLTKEYFGAHSSLGETKGWRWDTGVERGIISIERIANWPAHYGIWLKGFWSSICGTLKRLKGIVEREPFFNGSIAFSAKYLFGQDIMNRFKKEM